MSSYPCFVFCFSKQLKADHAAYYRDALRYLGCVDIADIPSKCTHLHACYFIYLLHNAKQAQRYQYSRTYHPENKEAAKGAEGPMHGVAGSERILVQ